MYVVSNNLPAKKCIPACNKFPCPKEFWSASFLDQITHVERTPGMHWLQGQMVSQASTDTIIEKTSMTPDGNRRLLVKFVA
jgi:hypothetical protein